MKTIYLTMRNTFIFTSLLASAQMAFGGKTVPLADQNPALFLDFSLENWSGPVVTDLVGGHKFKGGLLDHNSAPAICRGKKGPAVLRTLNSNIEQIFDSQKSLAFHQGEDYTIAGWFLFDPKNPNGQMIVSQRGDLVNGRGEHVAGHGPDSTMTLDFDGNTVGNAYSFHVNRQQGQNADLYSDDKFIENAMREDFIKKNTPDTAARKDPPFLNSPPSKKHPRPPGAPPEDMPPVAPPGTGGPIVVIPPAPRPEPIIPWQPPRPPNGPEGYTAKHRLFYLHGIGSDSAGIADLPSGRKEAWHFIAVSYTYQVPQNPHFEVYFYRVHPLTHMLQAKEELVAGKDLLHQPPPMFYDNPVNASMPLNERYGPKYKFRVGEFSTALFKDIAIYKKALTSRQVYELAKATAPTSAAYDCDFADYQWIDTGR